MATVMARHGAIVLGLLVGRMERSLPDVVDALIDELTVRRLTLKHPRTPAVRSGQ